MHLTVDKRGNSCFSIIFEIRKLPIEIKVVTITKTIREEKRSKKI